MGFFKSRFNNLFKPKKVITAAIIAGTLITGAAKIKQAMEEYKQIQKDPVVQLAHSSLEDFILTISNARDALNDGDDLSKLSAYEELLKKKPFFEDSIFNEKHINDLIERGILTSGETEVLSNMKAQFRQIFPQIEFEVERIKEKNSQNKKKIR
ncbi:MAG: hypothetical protein QXL18_02130 [Candidatus Woesearchaeota archaeon]